MFSVHTKTKIDVLRFLRFEESFRKAPMGDKSVETPCHIVVPKANLFPHLYNTTPSPLLNVGFPVSRICLFPVQHWKEGGGFGSQSKPDLKWSKWNAASSTRFSQLSQLFLSPIVRFGDGLVWTVGLTVEIKLRFQSSPQEYAPGLTCTGIWQIIFKSL